MSVLKRKTPCVECPFTRTSAPGWLGNSDPIDFMHATLFEGDLPCHMAVDYDDPNWADNQLPTAPMCAGRLLFLNNHLKLPRGRALAEACMALPNKTEAVFAKPEEFVEYHGGPPGANEHVVRELWFRTHPDAS